MNLPTLETVSVKNKTVLVRLDLNVPMQAGRVTDDTRIKRALPTLQHLIAQHAKVVILSHFGRPKGKVDLSLSLAPLVNVLSEALWDRPVGFSPDCVGNTAKLAVENAKPGDIILMENLRFHAEEEANDPAFGKELASLGDVYVNDAFSCSHRAHASIVGINPHLNSTAGKLLAEEVEALESIFTNPKRPLAAVVGGSKVSTKLELLENLVEKVDKLVIGGAMANTFLYALGHSVGSSLCEKDMKAKAQEIMKVAKKVDCDILLPVDVVVAKEFKARTSSMIVDIDNVPGGQMILDVGPQSIANLSAELAECQTVVWNGPVGAFETPPFDASTITLARLVAGLTRKGNVHSVAGGGDTVAALSHSGLASEFSYLSTAGGAFLEWLEGKELPGVAALLNTQSAEGRARA
ncbi:MAG: phosphoglycerate kinase [Rickettsiales bacterium]|nr:phosphoglycerate kinase [Rickettsiales bacterium]